MALTRINNNSLSAVTSAGLPTLTTDKLPEGSVLQVQNEIKRDVDSYAAGSWHTVLSKTITLSSSSNYVLIQGVVAISQGGGDSMVRIERDGTNIGDGTGGSTLNGIAGQPSGSYSNMTNVAACSFLDTTPGATTVTYTLKCRSPNNTVYVNRRGGAADFGGASYLTLMEIAGA